MWPVEHTGAACMHILVSIEQIGTIMKTFATKSLLVLVVAAATVRSYVTLALQTRVLPQHLA